MISDIIGAGGDFAEVEDLISDIRLPEEESAALWLFGRFLHRPAGVVRVGDTLSGRLQTENRHRRREAGGLKDRTEHGGRHGRLANQHTHLAASVDPATVERSRSGQRLR